MNVDLEVVEKELEYISLCIKACVNVEIFSELVYMFDSLNILYKHLCGESYEDSECPYINDELYIDYTEERIAKINKEFLERFENEKRFIAPAMVNYLEKFNDCYGELCYKDCTPRLYSAEEVKELITDYFSQYDKRIYDVATSIFDNKLIQTGISDTYKTSGELSELEYYLDMYEEINFSDYTEESAKRLIRFHRLILDKVDNDYNLSEERYKAYSERLNKHYDGLIPKDKSFLKKKIEYDDCGTYCAFAFSIPLLKKTYILTMNENVDIETIINIVHEIGHAIEDRISVFESESQNHYDTGYLSEVSSSYFEFGFINYLLEKNIDYDLCEEQLFDYYLDIYDDFSSLFDTIDLTPNKEIEGGQVTYSNDDYKCSVDLDSRLKYGLSRYIAIIVNQKYKDKNEDFYDLLKQFLDNRETLGTEELLNNLGISKEDLLNISFSNKDIDKLIKRFNN